MIIELSLLSVSILMFLKSRNIIVTLLVFFLLLFYVQVAFSELFFGVDFSPSAYKFDHFSHVYYSITIFVFIIYALNYNINTNFDFKTRFVHFKGIDVLLFLMIAGLAFYLLLTKGIRIDGSFTEHTDARSVLEDYLFLPVIVLLVVSKGRFLVVLSVCILILSYFLAGERMRMFVYVFILYFMFVKDQNSNYFRLSLFVGLGLAMLLSLFRSSFNISGEYHVTHFGSVTISSMYLMDYVEQMAFVDKLKYFLGIILGNIIPSSILPAGFDIRNDLFKYADIPGGGWFPVWFFSLAGLVGLSTISIIIASLIRMLSLKVNKYSSYSNKPITLFFMVFVATLPRWFMYTPYQILRFPLYIVIVYFGYLLIKQSIRGKSA